MARTPSAAEVVAQAAEVFTAEAAAVWFFAPHAELGARPVELLDSAPGRRSISDVLFALGTAAGDEAELG
jgi:uncharacterized protein (DUF2384 family)